MQTQTQRAFQHSSQENTQATIWTLNHKNKMDYNDDGKTGNIKKQK